MVNCNKQVECKVCRKSMRSDNFKRHIRLCKPESAIPHCVVKAIPTYEYKNDHTLPQDDESVLSFGTMNKVVNNNISQSVQPYSSLVPTVSDIEKIVRAKQSDDHVSSPPPNRRRKDNVIPVEGSGASDHLLPVKVRMTMTVTKTMKKWRFRKN